MSKALRPTAQELREAAEKLEGDDRMAIVAEWLRGLADDIEARWRAEAER